jgi:citrate synthase
MMIIKEKLAGKLDSWRSDIKTLTKEYGNVSMGEYTIAQTIGGMRGIKAMVCETSYLDPMEGIRFRGMTIPETRAALPHQEGKEPSPLGLWHLLVTGDIPTQAEVDDLENEFKKYAELPQYVKNTVDALPTSTHPMTQFTIGIAALQPASQFVKGYNEGMSKMDYWEPTLQDSVELLAKLPTLAAYIYRRTYFDGQHIPADPNLNWAENFAHMMGVEHPEYKELMKLYLILHSDHESGNVSAHTGHLVSSALSDVYYATSAAINGLAGPLHGLANQENLKWILNLIEKFNGVPSKEEIKKFAWDTLNSGQVIPGYGHAVLRQTDPRYTAQREFALRYLPEDPVFKTVSNIYEVVPDILKEHGKAKNPWPNVDAHSGCLQYYYGVKQFDFYTVLFGVSRALGITAQIIYDRAMGMPIERPKSVTVAMLKEQAGI